MIVRDCRMIANSFRSCTCQTLTRPILSGQTDRPFRAKTWHGPISVLLLSFILVRLAVEQPGEKLLEGCLGHRYLGRFKRGERVSAHLFFGQAA